MNKRMRTYVIESALSNYGIDRYHIWKLPEVRHIMWELLPFLSAITSHIVMAQYMIIAKNYRIYGSIKYDRETCAEKGAVDGY